MEVKLNMEIRAKVALSLPNKFYKVVLKYDTFEKATYDSYLVASIVANAKNEKDATEYIDEITGNGSLNPHFKKLYEEISKMTKEQVEGILKDSLFPITVVDKSHHFKYYEMFDATRMNNKVFPGNLENNPDLAKMLMPKDREAKFLSLEFETEDGTVKKDNYNEKSYYFGTCFDTHSHPCHSTAQRQWFLSCTKQCQPALHHDQRRHHRPGEHIKHHSRPE